ADWRCKSNNLRTNAARGTDTMSHVFYGRSDAAKGRDGALILLDTEDQPTVELAFRNGEAVLGGPSTTLPGDDQIVLVDGVERYYWIEQVGRLLPRRDLRAVAGHDLRRKPVRVITTDGHVAWSSPIYLSKDAAKTT
ncbi:MAG: hypothetical protein AAGC62_14215, partial [Pseudomonadota bacterium]